MISKSPPMVASSSNSLVKIEDCPVYSQNHENALVVWPFFGAFAGVDVQGIPEIPWNTGTLAGESP